VLYHRFPKLGVVCDVQTHFILAAHEGRGPKPDVADFRPLVSEALARVRLGRIVADAGYDSEPNHAFARRECRIRSIMPAKHGRPTTKPATGHYRRLMQTRFDLAAYRDRVQVETVISMLKRRLEAFVRGRTCWSQRRELRLKVLTHNVMILLRIQVFYIAYLTPLRSASSDTGSFAVEDEDIVFGEGDNTPGPAVAIEKLHLKAIRWQNFDDCADISDLKVRLASAVQHCHDVEHLWLSRLVHRSPLFTVFSK
jgi:Transposase DDE domain